MTADQRAVVHRRPGQGISYIGEICSPESSPETQKSAESVVSPTLGSHAADGAGVRTGHAYIGSACVDIRPSPKTDVLVTIRLLVHQVTFTGLLSPI